MLRECILFKYDDVIIPQEEKEKNRQFSYSTLSATINPIQLLELLNV